MFTLITAALVLPCAGTASAQDADTAAVKAAGQASYDALPIFDNGEAEGKVWAHTPYITFMGPGAKSIVVGWDNFIKGWQAGNKLFKSRTASMVEADIHIDGNVAWEAAIERGKLEFKTGQKIETDYIATNVFEKQPDGHWLMVSHHANPLPQ
jgi:ketosteroid isomerase-like protein